MKQFLLFPVTISVLVLSFNLSAKAQNAVLVSKTTYGDYMGYFPLDVDSKVERYYYNYDGVCIYKVSSGRTYNEDMSPGDFEPSNIVKASLDENGRVVKNSTYQWGVYDYEDMAWKKTGNDEGFAYDDKGRLLADTTSYSITVYSYNDDGTIATKNEYQKATGKLIQSIAYSNYDAKGNPTRYVSSSPVYDSYNYQGELTYDTNGNKTKEVQFTTKPNSSSVSEIKQVETWTYKGNNLRLYEKMLTDGRGGVAPYQKLTYMPVDGNENDVMVTDSTYFDGIWMQNGCAQRYIYADYAGMDKLVKMELSAVASAVETNTVDLTFSIPELAGTMTCRMVIYRDGQPIDTCDVADIMDMESHCCRYQDKGLKNATYDYFVQPLFGTNQEAGKEEMVWNGYFITDVVYATVMTELPAATGLALAGGKKVVTGTLFNPVTDYIAFVSWTNPENADDYGFISNSLYFDNYHIAEATTSDLDVVKLGASVYNDVTKAYVMTRYKYGKAFSDTIDIKLTDVDNLATGVEAVTVGKDVEVTFRGNDMTLGCTADVTVYALNGEVVLRRNGVRTVSLSELPAAIYIICIGNGEKTATYKYTVKQK